MKLLETETENDNTLQKVMNLVDFCGPLPSGEYLVVIVDEYSRFPIVESREENNTYYRQGICNICLSNCVEN